MDKGVFVSIAAGNEGQKGPFYSGAGSNGHNVMSVAAINVTSDLSLGTTDSSSQPVAAYFTSWGPTNELTMKPNIGAPGFDIISTYLDQTFHMDSGSSMAAPYIAGIAALYIAHHGGRELHGRDFAKKLATRIIASGRNVAWSTGTPRFNQTAPPFQVGSGLVDARKVIFSETELLFDPFSLRDTESFQPDWSAQITNNANRTINYTIKVEYQPGMEIYDGNSAIQLLSKLKPSIIQPKVKFPEALMLGSQQSNRIK